MPKRRTKLASIAAAGVSAAVGASMLLMPNTAQAADPKPSLPSNFIWDCNDPKLKDRDDCGNDKFSTEEKIIQELIRQCPEKEREDDGHGEECMFKPDKDKRRSTTGEKKLIADALWNCSDTVDDKSQYKTTVTTGSTWNWSMEAGMTAGLEGVLSASFTVSYGEEYKKERSEEVTAGGNPIPAWGVKWLEYTPSMWRDEGMFDMNLGGKWRDHYDWKIFNAVVYTPKGSGNLVTHVRPMTDQEREENCKTDGPLGGNEKRKEPAAPGSSTVVAPAPGV
jgi:hypothetical protein